MHARARALEDCQLRNRTLSRLTNATPEASQGGCACKGTGNGSEHSWQSGAQQPRDGASGIAIPNPRPQVLTWGQYAEAAYFMFGKKVLGYDWGRYVPDYTKCMEHFALHAGGYAVLKGIQKGMSLPTEMMLPSFARCARAFGSCFGGQKGVAGHHLGVGPTTTLSAGPHSTRHPAACMRCWRRPSLLSHPPARTPFNCASTACATWATPAAAPPGTPWPTWSALAWSRPGSASCRCAPRGGCSGRAPRPLGSGCCSARNGLAGSLLLIALARYPAQARPRRFPGP